MGDKLIVKRNLFLFFAVLLFSGCSKKEENSFIDLEQDDYFVCSYEASYQTEEVSSDYEAVLLNSEGELVEEFPGGFIRSILTEDGFMIQQGNGVVSKGTTLIISFPEDTWNYRTGAYLVGENRWLYESGEPVSCIEHYDDTGRLNNFQFGNEFYDRFFKKIPNEESAVTCCGTEQLHNEPDRNGNIRIVNKDGKVMLTPETFYQKNSSVFSESQLKPKSIELYDVYNKDCWKISYEVEGMYFPKVCLCKADGTIIEIQGLDYLNMDMGIDRYSYEYGVSSLESNQYLRLTDNISGREYCIKIEGAAAKLVELPEAEQVTYEGNNLFLLQNKNVYQIYDGKKSDIFCSINVGEEPSDNISVQILGKNAYYQNQIIDIEGKEAIQYKFIFQNKERNVDGSDVKSILRLKNGCSIIVINEKGSNVSLIVHSDGSYDEKIGKMVKWANDQYYLTYEKNMFFIYDMQDQLIKRIKLSL